jgi:hypothetical protein
MRLSLLRSALALTVLALLTFAPAPSRAQSLTTTFASDNGLYGNMFDLVASNPITITGFDINLTNLIEGETANVAVYYKLGTFAGSENNAAAWTLLGTQNGVVSNGDDVPTPLNIGGLALIPGQTYGVYVTTTNGVGLLYTSGSTTVSNADLQFSGGVGKAYGTNGFDGSTFTPRIWNGTIYYTPTDIPDPAELISDLIDDVNDLPIHHGIKNSFVVKLEAALAALEAGDDAAACDSLQAFINHAKAQSGKKLPKDDAEDLIEAAEIIREALGCS